jgi:hypothetical protein
MKEKAVLSSQSAHHKINNRECKKRGIQTLRFIETSSYQNMLRGKNENECLCLLRKKTAWEKLVQAALSRQFKTSPYHSRPPWCLQIRKTTQQKRSAIATDLINW